MWVLIVNSDNQFQFIKFSLHLSDRESIFFRIRFGAEVRKMISDVGIMAIAFDANPDLLTVLFRLTDFSALKCSVFIKIPPPAILLKGCDGFWGIHKFSVNFFLHSSLLRPLLDFTYNQHSSKERSIRNLSSYSLNNVFQIRNLSFSFLVV